MSLKRKGNFEYPKTARILSDKENINPATDNETTISRENSGTGSDASWGLGKLNLNAINKPFSYVNDNLDDGYETDDTVLEEDYVVPVQDLPKENSYQRYLRLTDKSKRNIDPGYETDDTVLDEDYEEYIKNKEKSTGGRRRTKRKRVRFSKTRKHIRIQSNAKKSHKRKRFSRKRKGKTRRY
jgi:hypothetical protein